LALGLISCGPALPDDVDSLIKAMNSNSETVAVAAANKVERNFGKQGLLSALRTGGTTARALAPRWLKNFPDAEVEQALVAVAANPKEHESPRISAIWTLGDIGTSASVSTLETLSRDNNSSVASMAKESLGRLKNRLQ
jgi:HEAT repeat protein